MHVDGALRHAAHAAWVLRGCGAAPSAVARIRLGESRSALMVCRDGGVMVGPGASIWALALGVGVFYAKGGASLSAACHGFGFAIGTGPGEFRSSRSGYRASMSWPVHRPSGSPRGPPAKHRNGGPCASLPVPGPMPVALTGISLAHARCMLAANYANATIPRRATTPTPPERHLRAPTV